MQNKSLTESAKEAAQATKEGLQQTGEKAKVGLQLACWVILLCSLTMFSERMWGEVTDVTYSSGRLVGDCSERV